MQAVVEHGGKLLRGMIGREIGPAYVTDEQRIPGKHGERVRRFLRVGDQNGDAFRRMAWRFKKAQNAIAEAKLVAIPDGRVGEFDVATGAEVDPGAGDGRELAMPGDEVGMQVRLDDVLDGELVAKGVFDVDAGVALRVDHGGNP